MKKLGLSLFLMCCALLVPTLLIIIQNSFNDPIYYTVIAITLVLVAVAVWQFALWYSNEKEQGLIRQPHLLGCLFYEYMI